MPHRTLATAVYSTVLLLALSVLVMGLWVGGQEPATSDSVWSPQRIVSFEHVNQELVIKCDEGLLLIKPYSDNIIAVRYYPKSEKAALPLWGISATPSNPKYRVDSTLSSIRLSTSQLTVSVDRKTAQITFLDQKQNVLLTSKRYELRRAQVSGEDTYSAHVEFEAPQDEAYYGLGQHQDGWLDQRGRTVHLWHEDPADGGNTFALPFLVTNRRYGLVFDNPSKTTVTPGKDGVTVWDAEAADALSYFVISGNVTDDLYRGYRLLTGTTPLPPESALGYIQGAQGYKTQREVMATARRYRDSDYPADILVVNFGDQDSDEVSWPDPAAMNAELEKLGFRVMTSCRLRIRKESTHFDPLDAMGCLVKNRDGGIIFSPTEDARGAWIDVTKSQCAEWFWNSLHDDYAKKGFSSWWLDEGEPDASSRVLHAGTGSKVINLYRPMEAKSVYDGYRQDMKERCFLLTPSAYLGTQQYGASFRSDSISAQWDSLRRQIPAGLNVAASGLVYWSSEIGGTGGNHDDSDYSDLYVRWFEFGAFCPTFRAHSPKGENELWSLGDTAEQILVKYLRLRYRLLPYIYSLAHSATETGAPFMRALFMDFPQDPEARDIKDEYMFGPALLVAPIIEKGKATREVYLPQGSAWIDYWTGKKYPGGQRIAAEAPLAVLPLFVRAGSIIPMGEDIPNARSEQKEIELNVYPGADARFDLYQDDGTTYEYEKGKFSLAQIRWTDSTQKITITGDDRKLFSRPQEKWLKIIK